MEKHGRFRGKIEGIGYSATSEMAENRAFSPIRLRFSGGMGTSPKTR